MYIKRIIAAVMAVIMLVFMCSCSMKQSVEPETSASETESNIVRVTFPEGFTVSDMAERLEENGVCSASDFMAAANDTTYLTDYGIEISDPQNRPFLLEGYLFPDTYDFYRGENINSVMKKFLGNFQSKITDDMKARAKELGYTIDEILTIASIIQEEGGGSSSEEKKISSVIHNRLDNASFPKLQFDSCSFYLRDSVKPYVSEENYETYLQIYSTYNCEGLPEGPITNPGIDSINAALYPDDTDYYFFVTDSDGVYYYAETWEQHQENCSRAGIQ